MANIPMNIEEIKKEISAYAKLNPGIIRSAVLAKDIELNKHTTKVLKGREIATVQALMGHVVQGFDSKKFTPYGHLTFKRRIYRCFHQKVDFQLDPAEIIPTLITEMYDEDSSLERKSISKLAMSMLQEKIISDVNILSIDGVYDETKISVDPPQFGYAMDGLNEIIKKLIANTDDPCFFVPGEAITDTNIVDVITAYERALPAHAKNFVKKIFMSVNDAERYQIAYEDKFGQNKFQGDALKSRLGRRQIVGLTGLKDGTIFSTVENGFFKIIDEVDNPSRISSVQIDKRILNVLAEFSLGYDFAVNPLVYVYTTDATKKRGLNNAELNGLYYPEEKGLTA